jgi:hypothetical protein
MTLNQNTIDQASPSSRQKIKHKLAIFDLIFLGIPLIVSLCFYIIILRYKYATGYWPEYLVNHRQIRSVFFSGEGIGGSLEWYLSLPAVFGLPFALISIPFGIVLLKRAIKEGLFSKKMILLMSIVLVVGGLLTLSIVTINRGFLVWLLD